MAPRESELALNYLVSAGVVAYQRAIAHAVGDALAGLFFSQLWYWAGRQPEDRDGWFFMTQEQLFTETALSRREQETSRRKLRELGLLEEELRGHPARLWYRISVRAVVQLLERSPHSQLGGKRQTSLYESAKLAGTNPPNKYGGKRQPSKISTKISSQTSAAASIPSRTRAAEERPPAAADSLAQELIAQGVSRSVAARLVLEKPEVCRRYLAYLPFAEIRTTKGAWLANAIRDEYGPPEGYVAAKQREERVQSRATRDTALQARLRRQDSLHRDNLARARATLARLEKEQGEAFRAFTGYVAQERRKAERMAAQLSAARQAECLAAFDAEEHRVELFRRWLEGQPGTPRHGIASA
jgi:hypothetical protein